MFVSSMKRESLPWGFCKQCRTNLYNVEIQQSFCVITADFFLAVHRILLFIVFTIVCKWPLNLHIFTSSLFTLLSPFGRALKSSGTIQFTCLMAELPQMCRTHKANIFVFSNGFKESSLRPSGRNSVLIIFLWEASQHCLLWCNSLLKKNSAQPTRTSSFTKCGFMWLAWTGLKNYSVVRKKHSTWNPHVID